MQKKVLSSPFFVILLVSLCFNLSTLKIEVKNSSINYPTINDDSLPDADKYVKLPYLPVDVDILFCADNLTKQAEYLNHIGNGSNWWMLPAWGACFAIEHTEGADKWCLSTNRKMMVKMPIAGRLVKYQVDNGSKINYNGFDLIEDTRLFIEIGKDCTIILGHVDLPESLHKEFLINPNYRFIKDQFLGYTEMQPLQGSRGINFYYMYKYKMVYPMPAFPQDYQEKITNYFAMQVERAEIAGVWPETEMYYPLDKHEANSLWGIWRYDTGPYDSYYEETEFADIRGSILTLYNRERTNHATFHKDPLNSTNDLSEDVIGLYHDYDGNEPTNYVYRGFSLLEQIEGDLTQGILELRYYNTSDYTIDTVYARFIIDFKGEEIEDDLLSIEYFNTLIGAQTGFTTDKITYRRLYTEAAPPWNYIVYRNIIIVGISGVIVLVAIITSIVIVVRRRKRSN